MFSPAEPESPTRGHGVTSPQLTQAPPPGMLFPTHTPSSPLQSQDRLFSSGKTSTHPRPRPGKQPLSGLHKPAPRVRLSP